ncbi:MAG TPA: DUF4389 domain-containing protein [bacterium]|nr:DUF4389 domain-containing protein [bacterium]
MPENVAGYPATLSIDYPERSDRFTSFFRLIMAVPILIILALLLGTDHSNPEAAERVYYVGTAGLVVIPTILLILFRQKYPRWWFDWNLAMANFITRIVAYVLLLRDEYPSTDEEQAVHIDIPYPNVEQDLHRWLPLVKWLLAIPHYIVLAFLWVAVVFCWIIAWFAILFTGRHPRGLYDFVVSVMRWSLRVGAYGMLLTTDQYPPFSLRE